MVATPAGATSPLLAAIGNPDLLHLDHLMPAVGGGLAAEAAPIYCSVAGSTIHTTTGSLAHETWFRLDAQRALVLSMEAWTGVDDPVAGLTVNVYLEDAFGRPGEIMTTSTTSAIGAAIAPLPIASNTT